MRQAGGDQVKRLGRRSRVHTRISSPWWTTDRVCAAPDVFAVDPRRARQVQSKIRSGFSGLEAHRPTAGSTAREHTDGLTPSYSENGRPLLWQIRHIQNIMQKSPILLLALTAAGWAVWGSDANPGSRAVFADGPGSLARGSRQFAHADPAEPAEPATPTTAGTQASPPWRCCSPPASG